MTIPRRLRPAPAWAHAHGVIDLRSGGDCDPLTRARLSERLHRYCWSFDERRADLLSDCFTADASWAGNVMGETRVGPLVGRSAVVDWLTGFWPYQRDQRRHVVANFIVEQCEPDSATCLAYLLLLGSAGRSVALESAGIYRVEFRREGDTWRICRLDAGFDVPFWKQEVDEMDPWVRDLFGIEEAHADDSSDAAPD